MNVAKRVHKLTLPVVRKCDTCGGEPPLDCSKPECLAELLPASQTPDTSKNISKSQTRFLVREKTTPKKAVRTKRSVIFYFSGLPVKERSKTKEVVVTKEIPIVMIKGKLRTKAKIKSMTKVKPKGAVKTKTTGRGKVTVVRKCPVCDNDCRHCDCWPVLLGSAMAFSR